MMSHPERAEHGRLTVEDLLHLKRSERPAPDFWNRFERELRAKQLAAIVEKRPWWITLRLPQAARYVSRFQIPAGVAAVLALSIVVVREYHPSGSPGGSTPAVSPVVSLETVAITNGEMTPVPPSMQVAGVIDDIRTVHASTESDGVLIVDSTDRGGVADPPPPATVQSPASFGPGGLMAMIPWAAPQPPADSSREGRQSVALGELPHVYFAAAAFPGREHNFEGRVEVDPVVMAAPAVATKGVETTVPALSMSPREVRRDRILASLVVADNTSESERSRLAQMREVLTSALDDDRLYDSVRRLGMGGDRLTLKF